MKFASEEAVNKLNKILEHELSGVVRYLHYSLMVKGPYRISLSQWLTAQSQESLDHANLIGAKITALGGHPSLKVSPIEETNKHSAQDVIKESIDFEQLGLDLYKELLPLCGENIALEELTREMIRTEWEHLEEAQKMLEDTV